VRLQIDPTLRIRAEERGQTQRSIYGDAALTFDDLIDATGGYIDGFRQRVLADAHRV